MLCSTSSIVDNIMIQLSIVPGKDGRNKWCQAREPTPTMIPRQRLRSYGLHLALNETSFFFMRLFPFFLTFMIAGLPQFASTRSVDFAAAITYCRDGQEQLQALTEQYATILILRISKA